MAYIRTPRATLPHAPLIYTLGMFRFPQMPQVKLTSMVQGFQEAIRAADYPTLETFPAQMVSAHFGPGGFQIEQQTAAINQLLSLDKRWAFILTDQLFCLHTIGYVNALDFVERFRVGLEALATVEALGISAVQAVGIRYVDLILPGENETIKDYLRSWVMPLEAPEMNGGSKLDVIGSLSVVSCRSEQGDFRFQALRNPPTTLPPDLETPMIQKNGWKASMPTGGEFVVLDSDHGCAFDPVQPFLVDVVRERLASLAATVEDWFEAAATDHAMQVWGRK